MTTLSIALDSPRQRDITLYFGDTSSIDVVVYAKDGDRTPIAPRLITDMKVVYGSGPYQQDTIHYTNVLNGFSFRSGYTITATINRSRVTLAYGIFVAPNFVAPTCGFSDYGWWVWGEEPPVVPPASALLAIDGLPLAIDGGLLYIE